MGVTTESAVAFSRCAHACHSEELGFLQIPVRKIKSACKVNSAVGAVIYGWGFAREEASPEKHFSPDYILVSSTAQAGEDAFIYACVFVCIYV